MISYKKRNRWSSEHAEGQPNILVNRAELQTSHYWLVKQSCATSMSPCESEVAAEDITFHIQLGHTVTYCDEMALPEFVEDEAVFSARACSDGAVELWQNFL